MIRIPGFDRHAKRSRARTGLTGIAATAVAVLLATGCAQAPPVPRDSFYRLDVPDPETAAAKALDRVVEVRSFDADGILGERAIVFVETEEGILRQYSLHFWVEPPTHAIQRELADHLRLSGHFSQVLTPRFRSRPDIQILGRIGRLEQTIDADGTSRVTVELEIGAERTSRAGGLLVLQTYRVEKPARDASPVAAVAAMRAAVREIFDRFTEDLVTAVRSER